MHFGYRYFLIKVFVFFLGFTGYALPKNANSYDFVVFFVVDQLRSQAIPPNFKHQGLIFTQMYLPYSCTETAPGHASLLSGRAPNEHGIVANSWYENGLLMRAGIDPNERILGEGSEPFSPKQFYGEHLSIYWKNYFPKSYFISISHKERSAAFLGGPKADLAISISKKGASTSTYYPLSNSQILDKINQDLKKSTQESLDEKTILAAESLFFSLNWQNSPNLVAISLSELDLLAHKHGYEHIKVQKHLQVVFKLITQFEQKLRKNFKNKKFLFFLTSDHGSTTIEREAQIFKEKASRITPQELYPNIFEIFPEKKPNILFEPPHFYTSHSEKEELASKILQSPYVYSVFLPKEEKYLTKNIPPQWQDLLTSPIELQNLIQNCYFEKRSPSLYVVLWPYVFLQDEKRQIYAGHGSPHPKDRHIPLLIWGDGIKERIVIKERKSALYIAKTLALFNGISYPHPPEDFSLLPSEFFSRIKGK